MLLATAAARASSVPGTLARAAASGPCAGRFANDGGSCAAGTKVHGPRCRVRAVNQRLDPSVHQAPEVRSRTPSQFVAHSTPSQAGFMSGAPSTERRSVGTVATIACGTAFAGATFCGAVAPDGGDTDPRLATTSAGGAEFVGCSGS